MRRGLLGAGLVAEADVARRLGAVERLVDVAVAGGERPAEGLGPASHRLLRAVQIRAAVVDRQALPDRVEVAIEVGAVEALEAELAGPLLTHPRLGAQAIGPVDGRAAAVGGSGVQGHVHVGRGVGAAAPVQVLVGPELVLVEVGLLEQAAGLEHQHLQPGAGQCRRDHAAAGARAHHHGVGLVDRVLAGRHQRRDRARALLGHRARPGVAEAGPERVAPAGVRHPVGEQEGEADQRLAPKFRRRTQGPEVAQQLLARAPRRGHEAHLRESVHELPQALPLLGRQALDGGHQGLVGADVGARPGPEAIAVAGFARAGGRPCRRRRPGPGSGPRSSSLLWDGASSGRGERSLSPNVGSTGC